MSPAGLLRKAVIVIPLTYLLPYAFHMGSRGVFIAEPVSKEDEDKTITEYEKEFTNFAAYLLYRYKGAGRFAAESVYLLSDLVLKGCGIQDVARVFSCEVEYSDINIDEALETFS